MTGKSVGPAERPPASGAPSAAHLRAPGNAGRLQGVVSRVQAAHVGDALDDHQVGAQAAGTLEQKPTKPNTPTRT